MHVDPTDADPRWYRVVAPSGAWEEDWALSKDPAGEVFAAIEQLRAREDSAPRLRPAASHRVRAERDHPSSERDDATEEQEDKLNGLEELNFDRETA